MGGHLSNFYKININISIYLFSIKSWHLSNFNANTQISILTSFFFFFFFFLVEEKELHSNWIKQDYNVIKKRNTSGWQIWNF
jgi:hypothetical protein